MKTPPTHCASKGCYLVIGRTSTGTEYTIGQYISFSRAKKTARNKARLAKKPTSADTFFVYDSKGACRYSITGAELPPHLRHSAPQLSMPEGLPFPKRYYLREALLVMIAVLVAFFAYRWATNFEDNKPLSALDSVEYAHMYQQFNNPDERGKSCKDFDGEYYELRKHMYEQELQSPALPASKQEYLQDKLHFYPVARKAPAFRPGRASEESAGLLLCR